MGTLYAIAYAEAALASLRSIEPKKVRQQIVNKSNWLCEDAHPPGSMKVQGMSDEARDVYRIRSGDYRVLYCENSASEILVLDIGHRKDIYRNR